jgi:hypothetical protein
MEEAQPRFLGDEGFGPDYEMQLDEVMDRLEALLVVKDAHIDVRQQRIIANLWCRLSHPAGILRQPYVKKNQKPDEDPAAVPTYLVAAQKLIEKIEAAHGNCLEAAEAARMAAAAHAAAAQPEARPEPTHTLDAMMRLQSAKLAAAKANAIALAAEHAKQPCSSTRASSVLSLAFPTSSRSCRPPLTLEWQDGHAVPAVLVQECERWQGWVQRVMC